MRKRQSRRQRAFGQTIAEFGLAVAPFMVLLFGIIDGGLIIWSNSVVSQASREAARVAAVEAAWITPPSPTDPSCVTTPQLITATKPGAHVCPNAAQFAADISLAARSSIAGVASTAPPTISFSCDVAAPATPPIGQTCVSHAKGNIVTVSVVATVRPFTPIIGAILPPITLTGVTAMVIN